MDGRPAWMKTLSNSLHTWSQMLPKVSFTPSFLHSFTPSFLHSILLHSILPPLYPPSLHLSSTPSLHPSFTLSSFTPSFLHFILHPLHPSSTPSIIQSIHHPLHPSSTPSIIHSINSIYSILIHFQFSISFFPLFLLLFFIFSLIYFIIIPFFIIIYHFQRPFLCVFFIDHLNAFSLPPHQMVSQYLGCCW